MKFPKSVAKLFYNKTVYYIVAFLAIANVVGYLFLGNFVGVFIFFLVGFITYMFEKNPTFVLLVSLVATSLLMMGKKVKEGLEGKTSDSKKKPVDKTKPSTLMDKAKKEMGVIFPPSDASSTADASTADASTADASSTNSSSAQESSEPVPSETKTDGMRNKKWNNNRIDKFATLKDSYEGLSNILGSDGMKNLSNDTQQLIQQQKDLAKMMQGMMPMVQQAQEMLKGMDLTQMGGLAEMAKKFTAGSK
jgi:hypothetical protein